MYSNEQPPPDLVHRPSTFTAKFRRRRKSSSTYLIFTLIITTIITSSQSLPFISNTDDHGTDTSSRGNSGDCEMISCFGGAGEQPNLISMSCPALKSLHQCLKTLKCNGNLQYHTFQWMVRNSKRRCRSGNGNGGGDHPPKPSDQNHSHHHHSSRSNRNRQHSRTSSPSPSSTSSSLLRSGDTSSSYSNFQQQLITSRDKTQQSKQPHPPQSPPHSATPSQPFSHTSSSSQSSPSSPPPWKSVSEQYCLSAAYNFTIGEAVLDSAHFAAIAFRASSQAVANPEEHQQLLAQVRNAQLRMTAEEESSDHTKRRRLQRRDTSARIDAEMRKRLGDAFKDYFRGQMQNHQQLNPQTKVSESTSQDFSSQSQSAAARAYRDTSSGPTGQSIPPPSTSLSELHYKPVAPMTPSLTCMIFGDPHLRTFDSRYQTCSLLGARSLIEHPLFDVQITNTRLQEQFNATGVTKVIVQVRHFSPCAIATDLLYETDSLTQDLPSSTFTDGSREHSTSAGLIRISTSSEALGLVVTIHLDHLGVRIYISQFTHTKFINVVIKFRTATSASVKQKLVLEAISAISLCKSGCNQRELVDVEGTLKAAGIETKEGGGKGTKGPVPQRVDSDSYEDGDDQNRDENEDEEDGEEDEVYTGKVTGTVAEDEEAEDDQDDDDDDEYYDDFSKDDQDYSADSQLMPQKDPRAKRVKKETTAESESNRKKNRRKEGRKNLKSEKRYLESSPSALLPPVPLHLLHLQPPPSPQSPAVIFTQNLPPPQPPELPTFSQHPYQSKPPSLTEECHEMMPFYRLACLYDTVLKGIVSNVPHKFALSFDEPRLPAEFYSSSSVATSKEGGDSSGGSRSFSTSAVGPGGTSPSSASPVTDGIVVLSVVITTFLLTQL